MAVGGVDTEVAAKLATDILVAYLSNTSVPPADLARLIGDVRAAFEGPASVAAPGLLPSTALEAAQTASPKAPASASAGVQAAAPRPAVPIEQSVTDEYVVSLEDGGRYRSLRRHLMAKYGMTPEQYREKWGLPIDYPMVAPSYARERSEVAKRIGLGRPVAKAPARSRRPSGARKV
ncbi:MucR family transcriptional regulator [Phenylobacterium sp.]|uniref:MucR family transcriptional regulator n=1 Tax=Phenylobacterium sp. TaxID=1871053 RepID=UPI003BABA068